MEKLFFGIGHSVVEERIKQLLDDAGFQYEEVYTAGYKEAIANEIGTKRPTILIINEGLPGKTSAYDLAITIKRNYSDIRIIFLASDKKIGDPELANLVAFNIYDILCGEKIQVQEIVRLIITPNTFDDSVKYLPQKKQVFEKGDDFKDLEDNEGNPTGELGTSNEINISISAPQSETENKKEDITIGGIPIPKFGKKFPNLPFIKKRPEDIGTENKKPSRPPAKTNSPPVQEEQNDDFFQIQQTPNIPEQESQSWQPAQNQSPVKKEEYRDDDYIPYEVKKVPSKGNAPIKIEGNRILSSQQRLITFYSTKAGIGTTVLALNSAYEAAKRANQKILLIELNTEYSSLAYWFYFPKHGYGLEDALMGIGNDFSPVLDAIVTKEKLLKSDSDLDGYRKFPDSLDFLVFSDTFMKKNVKPPISGASIEKLITYCLFYLKYDKVFLDVATSMNKDIIGTSLISSGKNVILLSQDTAIINNTVMFFYDLGHSGVKFDIGVNKDEEMPEGVSRKNIYVVNKYANSAFTEKKIKEWVNCTTLCNIPENGAEINELLSVGLIPLSLSKFRLFKDSFKYLGNLIEQ